MALSSLLPTAQEVNKDVFKKKKIHLLQSERKTDYYRILVADGIMKEVGI